MRKFRFYYPDGFSPHATVTLDQKSSHHIMHVLRLKKDQNIELFDGKNNIAQAYISSIQRSNVSVTIQSIVKKDTVSPLYTHIGQVIGKASAMDIVVQKATELGVSRITPIIGQNTMFKREKNKLVDKKQHWENIAVSACAQSHRNDIPEIDAPILLNDWLHSDFTNSTKLVLHPKNEPGSTTWPTAKSFVLLIGSEGGLSEDEVSVAEHYGFDRVSLGPRILRLETAAIASVTILQHQCGDLK